MSKRRSVPRGVLTNERGLRVEIRNASVARAIEQRDATIAEMRVNMERLVQVARRQKDRADRLAAHWWVRFGRSLWIVPREAVTVATQRRSSTGAAGVKGTESPPNAGG